MVSSGAWAVERLVDVWGDTSREDCVMTMSWESISGKSAG